VASVVITGAAGFLGSRLARALLASGEVGVAGGRADSLTLLTLIDRIPAPADLAGDKRVAAVTGDLAQVLAADGAGLAALATADLVFHLAAAVSAECEADAAASGFLSGIIREPLAGQRATCPVAPDTEVALASPAKAVGALLRAASASAEDWGGRTAMAMPALTVTVADMATALARIAGPRVREMIDWTPDQAIAQIVSGWPARIRAERAARLGLAPDPDIDTIIRMHLAEAEPGPRPV
jgi:nucleoside-diphosphate-sugar epimerase